jgi:hypothetical protein
METGADLAKMVRTPARSVQLDDIIAGGILGADSTVVALVLKIHLALEALIIEMIQLRESDPKIYKWNFPTKTEYLVKHGLIQSTDKEAFDLFNDVRNDFAHIFGHPYTLKAALVLAKAIEEKGVDFSDSVGHYTEAQAEEFYDGLVGVLTEVGWCLLFHAGHLLSEGGGRDIAAAPPGH